MQAKRYRAFISYSQKDKAHAKRLHKALETYRLPKGVSAPGVDPKSRRLGRFFRDDEEMGAATDLGEALRGAIADSDNLIVLCSPRAAQSKWVNEEILHFKRTGRAANVFAVIVDGLPNSGDPKTECFPPALRFAVDETGALTNRPADPLGLDQRKERLARLKARLAAGLLGVSFDDLWLRDRRRARARAMAISGVSFCALVAAGLGAGWAIRSVSRSAAEARQERATRIAQLALTMRAGGGAPEEQAILMALLAVRTSGDAGARWLGDAPGPSRQLRAALAVSVADRRVERIIHAHDEPIRSVAWSPDESFVVSGSQDASARVWDMPNGELRATLTGHQDVVTSVAVAPDGNRIVTGSHDQTAKTWRVSGEPLSAFAGHTDAVNAVAFSPDGSRIVTGSADFTARVWDANNANLTGVIRGTGGRIGALAITPDGTGIVTAAANSATLWDAVTFARIREVSFHGGPQGVITSVSVARDPAWLMTTAMDGQAIVAELANGDAFSTFGHEDGRSIEGGDLYASPVVRLAITASDHGPVTQWDAHRGSTTVELDPPAAVNAVSISPSGRRALMGTADGDLILWRTRLGRVERRFDSRDGFVSAITASPSGERIVSAVRLSQNEAAAVIRIWNAATGDVQLTLAGGFETIDDFAFSPDGARILSKREGTAAMVWDASTGAEIATLKGQQRAATSVAIDPTGRRALTGSNFGVSRLWDLETQEPLATLGSDGSFFGDVEFSPDGQRALTTSHDSMATLWDLATYTEILTLKGHTGSVEALAFSPGGRRAATGAHDETARIWDLDTGEPQMTLAGHSAWVRSVAFSPDGVLVLTASQDQTAKLWDAATGDLLATFEGAWISARFMPDGRRILAGSDEGGVALWEIPEIVLASAQRQVEIACKALRDMNAPLAFSVDDIQRYPILADEPRDPDNPDMLWSPCEGIVKPDTGGHGERGPGAD